MENRATRRVSIEASVTHHVFNRQDSSAIRTSHPVETRRLAQIGRKASSLDQRNHHFYSGDNLTMVIHLYIHQQARRYHHIRKLGASCPLFYPLKS